MADKKEVAVASSAKVSDTIKTALVVGGGSVALIIFLALLAHFAVGGYGGRSLQGDAAMSDAAVAKRLQPVGELVIADANAPKVVKTGEQVYTAVCAACHAAGVLNAPKFGDKAGWAAQIKAGFELTVKNAINGIKAMPPRGGNPELTDVEVARAVAHMANAAGANFKAPEPSAAPQQPAVAPTVASVAAPVAAAPAATGAPAAGSAVAAGDAAAKGKSVYESSCAICHGAGVAGAPRPGDKTAWSARIAQGADVLHAHALKGFQGKAGVMPPKGGNLTLVDADVMAAVDYMVAQSK